MQRTDERVEQRCPRWISLPSYLVKFVYFSRTEIQKTFFKPIEYGRWIENNLSRNTKKYFSKER